MAQLPHDTVRATLAQDHEIPAATTWAARRGVDLSYDEETLTLKVVLEGPPGTPGGRPEAYRVTADLEDYDMLPPVWRFLDPRTEESIGPAAYPQAAPNSVFHGNGLVCAPWSRLAYQSEGGPHQDWGAMSSWKSAAPGHTRATCIPDMLDRLFRDLARSSGRMAPLPVRT